MSNELDPRLLSVVGLNSFAGHNSSVRQYMFNSHISQAVVIDGCMPKRIQTGMEKEFGKYTFNVKMPADGKIIAIIEKYNTVNMAMAFNLNPAFYLVFENLENGEIDYLEVPIYRALHYIIGFEMVLNKDIYSQLRVGNILRKGTIIADSKTVDEVGNYRFGIELNMAFMSHPAVAEDGLMICRDVLEKLKYTRYEKRVFEFGETHFPLNLYGTENEYKPFPDIGDYVRDDAILGATRAYGDGIAAATMSLTDTMKVDYTFDKLVYATSPKSRVIDVKFFHNVNNKYQLPEQMRPQLDRYAAATRQFYEQILEVEKRQKALYRRLDVDRVPMSFKFHRLVVEAYNMTENGRPNASEMINKVLKNKPIDTYLIEFTLATESIPDIGSKMSGIAGDKGVIVSIGEPDEMPIDADGVRADIISDDVSTANRMNISKLYEQYIGRVCLQVEFNIREVLGLERHKHYRSKEIDKRLTPENTMAIQQILLEFYGMVSQKILDHFQHISKEEWHSHILYVVSKGIYLYIPPNHDKNAKLIVKDLYARYKVKAGPVRFKDKTGKVIETKNGILIGPLYMMLSEKIGDSWSATSSAKYQHFGNIAAPVSKAEKYGYPYKNTAVRALGETESRSHVAYTVPNNIAELMDRSSNPITHREIVKSILNAEHPTAIPMAIDREKMPYGGVKPLQYVKHLLFCAGIRLEYIDQGEYRPNG